MISVTGTWGWSAVPADLVLAVAQAVANEYKRDSAIGLTAVGDVGIVDPTRRVHEFPPYVMEKLKRYVPRHF
jgi:hypothetical protein